MVSSKYYVPILKSKRGEMAALRYTYDDVTEQIVPLVEVLPDYTKTKATVYTKLKKSWRSERMLVDVNYCEDKAVSVFGDIYKELSDTLRIIPVLHTSDSSELVDIAKQIVSKSQRGMCIRIDDRDLKDLQRVDRFIALHNLDRKRIALLADFSYIIDEAKYSQLIDAVNNVTGLSEFNALIIASGCSPDSLVDFKVGEDNFIERLEWQYWSKHRSLLNRDSIYGDYTTQHPFVLPPGNYPGSKSIRYTIKDQIAVYRGKQSDPQEAYLEHAAQLCDYTDYFCGRDYSYGDEYIQLKRDIFDAGGTGETGNPTNWVAVRINHHMAFVVKHDLATIAA